MMPALAAAAAIAWGAEIEWRQFDLQHFDLIEGAWALA
jgi:hypothetical protein